MLLQTGELDFAGGFFGCELMNSCNSPQWSTGVLEFSNQLLHFAPPSAHRQTRIVDRFQATGLKAQPWNAFDEGPRVGVLRLPQDCFRAAKFHDAAPEHHGDLVRQSTNDSEIVSNQ